MKVGHGQGSIAAHGVGHSCGHRAHQVWLNEIAFITHLLEVWDLAKNEAAGPLGRWVIWRDRPRSVALYRVEGRPGPAWFKTLASENDPTTAELLERWRYGDVVGPAGYYVHLKVNDRLRGHASPVVLPFRKGEIFMFPDSLLAAVYTLFAMELSGRQRPAIICHGCDKYFIPKHGRQQFCEEACRKRKWYRDHKEKRG